MTADEAAAVVLAVAVVCPACGERRAGNLADPLPETWPPWVAALHRVEQALHAAAGCDQPVRLRLTRAPEPAPTRRLEPAPTVLPLVAAAAPGLPPVFPGAQPALALFAGWSPELTVVALGVVGVVLVFLAGLIVGDLIRMWREGKR